MRRAEGVSLKLKHFIPIGGTWTGKIHMEDQNLPLRPWSQRVGQEGTGKVPSVFGTLSTAFLCEKFPAQLEGKKSSYKTSDNFSSENFVLGKSADPIKETFQNLSHFCHIG